VNSEFYTLYTFTPLSIFDLEPDSRVSCASFEGSQSRSLTDAQQLYSIIPYDPIKLSVMTGRFRFYSEKFFSACIT